MTPFPDLKLEVKAPLKCLLTTRIYLGTRHNIPEDFDIQQNRCQHLKSRQA
jgi:hypothetical protein